MSKLKPKLSQNQSFLTAARKGKGNRLQQQQHMARYTFSELSLPSPRRHQISNPAAELKNCVDFPKRNLLCDKNFSRCMILVI